MTSEKKPRDIADSSRRVALAASKYMKDRGITQPQIAADIDRSQGYVSEHLNGKRPVEFDILDAIARRAGVSVYAMMTELSERALGPAGTTDTSSVPARPAHAPSRPGVPGSQRTSRQHKP